MGPFLLYEGSKTKPVGYDFVICQIAKSEIVRPQESSTYFITTSIYILTTSKTTSDQVWEIINYFEVWSENCFALKLEIAKCVK